MAENNQIMDISQALQAWLSACGDKKCTYTNRVRTATYKLTTAVVPTLNDKSLKIPGRNDKINLYENK